MKCPVAPVSGRPAASLLQVFPVSALFALLLFFPVIARSQSVWVDAQPVHSVSGQFLVTAVPALSPLLHDANLAADTNLVRLEPPLLAVSAERFKLVVWSQLGLTASSGWSGRIFLTLRPAGSVNDEVNINIGPLEEVWNYHVELPDVVTRTRYARALTATILLEIANRNNHNANHSAELPPWLTDGISQQVLGGASTKIVLTSPARKTAGVVQSRIESNDEGLDPLAAARRTLKDQPALTFDQLCWPTDAQMNGEDGGAYLASAQLFAISLLGLDHGTEKMRDLLARLPDCMNWQTAFFAAFSANFRRPLDVEKWWALRVIRFAVRDPGPRLTPEASRDRLADLLAVPVEFRRDEHALPEHTVVSLQDAMRNFPAAQVATILEIKRRDFELARFRMAQPFAGLAEGYRVAISDYLGEGKKSVRVSTAGRWVLAPGRSASLAETLSKLDTLDARRREVETKLDASPLPKTANPLP